MGHMDTTTGAPIITAPELSDDISKMSGMTREAWSRTLGQLSSACHHLTRAYDLEVAEQKRREDLGLPEPIRCAYPRAVEELRELVRQARTTRDLLAEDTHGEQYPAQRDQLTEALGKVIHDSEYLMQELS